MVPGLGVFPDVLNAGIYLANGNYEEALWSGVGAVPVVGDATSGIRNVNKLSKAVNKGGKKKKWDSDRPGGYKVFDTGKHGKLSPKRNRAYGNTNTKKDRNIQSHHPIQDLWAKKKSRGMKRKYNSKEAPTILLPTDSGGIHSKISGMQRTRRGKEGYNTDIKYEFNESYRELIQAGVQERYAQKSMKKAYKYFDGIGWIDN